MSPLRQLIESCMNMEVIHPPDEHIEHPDFVGKDVAKHFYNIQATIRLQHILKSKNL